MVPSLITVVGTGNTPFDLLTANTTYRDTFFDAPLDALWGEDAPNNATLYTSLNLYYAMTSFAKAFGKPWHGSLTADQVLKIRGHIQAAKSSGLQSRYWDLVAWPVSTRDHVRDMFEKEGIGMLNVDDLESANGRKW